MFIAMNRFRVLPDKASQFEARWLDRDVYLNREPGFIAFHLLKGAVQDDHILYSSHTAWSDKAAFADWTRSDSFRIAHRSAGQAEPLTLGHPQFEGFDVLQEILSAGSTSQLS
jgi:heme-degrading monooxygenase HmoA